MVSQHGWAQAAEHFSRELQGTRLRDTRTADSSAEAVAISTGRAHQHGAALRAKPLPELAVRDILQARSHCFPTAAVARNRPGVSPLCLPVCRVEQGSTYTAHGQVARVLFESIQAARHRRRHGSRVLVRGAGSVTRRKGREGGLG